MYIRGGIRARHLFYDSWRFVVIATIWSTFIVTLYEIVGIELLAIPILPVSTIGIAVSLYLGFKSSSSYARWWEARMIWGEIINKSRAWSNYIHNMIEMEDEEEQTRTRRDLIMRHIAWVNALAYQLRKTSRLKESEHSHIFDYRRKFSDLSFHQHARSYERHLDDQEAETLSRYSNPATHLIRHQGERLRELVNAEKLGDRRYVEMMNLISEFYDFQGKCERIKNTPFPRQIAVFGQIFTWIFILLLPLAFLETFAKELAAHKLYGIHALEYMFSLVPFTVLISWIFFMMEKVADSSEDPFEGGANDVPISTLCRAIEIDLRQSLDDKHVPPPLRSIDGILY